MDAILVSTQLLLQLLILLVIEHHFLEGGEEAIGEWLLAEADGGDGLGGEFLWSVLAYIGMQLAIAHLVPVLEVLDLSMKALVLQLEVVIYLHQRYDRGEDRL